MLTDTAGQACVGEGHSKNYQVEAGFWPNTGSPPVATALALTAIKAQTIAVQFEDILDRTTDPDGDSIKLLAEDVLSINGGTVRFGSNSVYYTGPPGLNGLDEFTCTLVDAGGDVAFCTVSVLVLPEGGATRIVEGPKMLDGVLVVRYAGAPGLTYTIESTDTLVPPNWHKQFNVTAPVDPGAFGLGVFELRQAAGPGAARFFRTVYPSY